jgi:amino acid transporter
MATLRKEAGMIGLLYTSLGSMIGSGWLFGPLHAAQMAGPYALAAWGLGGLCILLLALVFAEIGTLVPHSGAIVHYPHLSHGAMVARIFSWINFLGYVVIPPVEAMAILSYANNLFPGLTTPDGLLTTLGFITAFILLAIFAGLNFLAIRWVLLINSAAMWWKLLVPGLTVAALMMLSFHPENLSVHSGDTATTLQDTFKAMATSGVVFSYLGFRQAIELAGETSNPRKTLPVAVLGSVLVGMLLYAALQLAFLLAVDPATVARQGWAHLEFKGMAGPFAGLAMLLGAGWLATLLFVDAFISPGGTGFIYQTSATRVTMAMADAGLMPSSFGRLNRFGVPWVAGIVSFLAGAVFLFPFPSWQKLVGYVSSISVLSYSIGPIVLLALRRALPEAEFPRQFRLPAAPLLASVTFIVSNLIVYWTGRDTVNILFGLLAAAFAVWLLHYALIRRQPLGTLPWRRSLWLFVYFGGFWLISQLGAAMFGGSGGLPFPVDMVVMAAFSLFVLWLASRTILPGEEVQAYLDELEAIRAGAAP